MHRVRSVRRKVPAKTADYQTVAGNARDAGVIIIGVMFHNYARFFYSYFIDVFKCFYDVGVVWEFKVFVNAKIFQNRLIRDNSDKLGNCVF